ncbi:MAG: FtsH protease activity modulator HflK [Pseudomonadales bacterium]
MAWNEPGGGKKPNDPWGGDNDKGPPDLDEALKKLQEKLGGLFGGGSGGGSGSAGINGSLIVVGILVAVVLWFASGIYKVDEQERAVILRLGKFYSVVGPGLHWNPRFIESKTQINVTAERQYTSRGLMLTQDENIVELPLTVQYNIVDAKAFALNVRDPEMSLQHATDSALRHVVGSNTLDKALSDGRAQIGIDVQARLQEYLNIYGTGINIIKVNLQRAEPPKEVKAAFDDVIEAKEDRERYKNEAQAYANGVVPEARGKAQRVIEEANAYQAQVIAQSQGEAQRFDKLLEQYQKAPEVTRERLYVDSVQEVMASSSKVMVGPDGGNNLLYLPLDQMVKQGQTRSAQSGQSMNQEAIEKISEQVLENLRRTQSSSSRGESR